jgi:hypothetical protein
MSPIYVKKLPWKFDIDRLQKELQPLKSLFIPWDPDTKEDFNDSYILGFLHSKDCPPEKRLYDSVRSFCPKRPSVFSSSSGYKYNILKPIIHDGTSFNKRLKRFKVREDYTVFNEDYLDTEFYNIYKKLTTYYEIDRFRIMMLKSLTAVNWHQDSFENIHVPIETNIGCRFVIDDRAYYLPADGSSYQADNCINHSIFNAGLTDRFNLLICIAGYKEESYKLCHHSDVYGLIGKHSDPKYIAEPIEQITEEDLYDVHQRRN